MIFILWEFFIRFWILFLYNNNNRVDSLTLSISMLKSYTQAMTLEVICFNEIEEKPQHREEDDVEKNKNKNMLWRRKKKLRHWPWE